MDHSIYIWSTQDHRLVKRLRGHTGEVGGAFINRDGDTLISFDNYGEMLKWEWSTSPDEFLGYKANDRLWRNDLGWYISPSDPELIYFNTHPDWEVEGINLAKMKREKTFASHGLEGLSVDGTEMITFRPFGEDREQGEIVRWNLVSETSRAIKIPISREGPQDWPHCQVNYCPEQEEILFSWDSSTFYLLDATTGMIQQSLRPDEKKLFSLINISPQGQWLVLSPEDNIDEGDEVYIFKRVQSQYQLYRVVKLFGNGQVIHTLDFSDDERWLGVLSFEHYGILLDLNEPNNDPIQIGAGKRGIRCIDFAPDGRSVVLGSDDGTLRAWLIETRRELFAIRPGFFIDRVQFSPDDQWLIASGGSKTPYRADRIIRWKIRNGENETAND